MEIFTSILMLLAGSGVFMAGMNMMSDGLERSAGAGMKRLFNKISNNRFAGVGIGASVTAIIQSSAATTVMAIGFVNAGVMTLAQATAIIMGANIGTTVTGLIVSLSALNISLYASVLAFIGVMMMFFKSDMVKKIGGIMCGLGLVFIGLDLMSDSFGGDGSAIKLLFTDIFTAIDFPLLLILVGVIFTAIIQSSSAATGLLIIMVGAGTIDVGNALFIVLGSNIGTCITAALASIGTSTNAKRTAFIHLTFNVIGTVLFTVILWIFGDHVVKLLETVFNNPQMQLAWFHVAFNVITTCMLIPFIKQLVRFAELVIKDKATTEEEDMQLKFIDDRLLHTPPVAVAQVQKEIVYMSELAKENLGIAMGALYGADNVDKETLERNEARINHTYHGIASYLIKLSSQSLAAADEKLMGAYHHVISNIERIGDHAENFVETAEQMKADGVHFSDAAVAELAQMYKKVDDMFVQSMAAFANRDFAALDAIAAIEDEIDGMQDALTMAHVERLNKGACVVELGSYFYAAISALERIGDHLINIAFSIKNPTGSQSNRAEINDLA